MDASQRRRAKGREPRAPFEGELARQTPSTVLTEAQKLRWKAMLGLPFQPQLAQSAAPTEK